MSTDAVMKRRVAVLSVSELNWRLRTQLEADYSSVWIAGEISNLRVPASGHVYFRLKDDKSQIAAVVFRSSARRIRFQPRDGMEVLVRGRVSLYEARGDLQVYVDAMEPQGVGSAQLALQQLKEKLAAEGLFDADRKQPLPAWPATVGVITAASGAAIHDIVVTLRERFPGVRILLRPVTVQGKLAGGEIVRALRDIEEHGQAEVVIVGRGGGSAEDLWAFNEERVARAIGDCSIPTVSAVGHEIDVTLADLVADFRAATPTAAAAAVVPDCRAVAAAVRRTTGALRAAMMAVVGRQRDRLTGSAGRLRDPRAALRAQRLRIDELGERGRRALQGQLSLSRERVLRGAERLDALSPLAVLKRGYTIARKAPDGAVVRSAAELERGDAIELLFGTGKATARIEETD